MVIATEMGGIMAKPVDLTNNSAFEYGKAALDQLLEICGPFLENFNITTFIYGRVFYDGSYLLLSNNMAWFENWLLNVHSITGSVLHSTLLETPTNGFYYKMWPSDPSDKIITLNNSYNIWNGFSVNRRLEDSLELWSFGTENEDIKFYNFYLNNITLLNRFCLSFNDKCADIIAPTDNNRLAVFKEHLDLTYHENISFTQKYNEIIGLTDIEKYPLKTKRGSIYISKREFECMFYLSQGKTAKEIGRSLNLSYRTIQFYIENIKRKTGYQSKSALGDLFRETLQRWW